MDEGGDGRLDPVVEAEECENGVGLTWVPADDGWTYCYAPNGELLFRQNRKYLLGGARQPDGSMVRPWIQYPTKDGNWR